LARLAGWLRRRTLLALGTVVAGWWASGCRLTPRDSVRHLSRQLQIGPSYALPLFIEKT
jgi:hypothetical protein